MGGEQWNCHCCLLTHRLPFSLRCVISNMSPGADGSREGHESVPSDLCRDHGPVTVPLSEMEK